MSVTNVAVVFWYEQGQDINTLVANETKDIKEDLKNNNKMLELVRKSETANFSFAVDAKQFFAKEAKKLSSLLKKHIQFGEVIKEPNRTFRTTYRYIEDNPKYTIINGPMLEDETPLEAIERIIIEATGYKVKKPELFLIEMKHKEILQKKEYIIFTHKIKLSEVDKIFNKHLEHRQQKKHRGVYSNFKFIDANDYEPEELTGYSSDILYELAQNIERIKFENELATQGWQKVYSNTKSKYYWYNIKTKETTWTTPGVKVSAKKTKKSKRGGRKTRKVR